MWYHCEAEEFQFGVVLSGFSFNVLGVIDIFSVFSYILGSNSHGFHSNVFEWIKIHKQMHGVISEDKSSTITNGLNKASCLCNGDWADSL